MKLKLLPLNNDMKDIIYIGNYQNHWCQVYYDDKHYEIYDMSVHQFLKYLNNNNSPKRLYKSNYHSPIIINNCLFSPTKNIKNSDCEYFNLLKVEEKDIYYENLLDSKKLLDKAKQRFIKYKTQELFDC